MHSGWFLEGKSNMTELKQTSWPPTHKEHDVVRKESKGEDKNSNSEVHFV